MISAYRSLWKGQHCLNTRIEYTLARHLCMKIWKRHCNVKTKKSETLWTFYLTRWFWYRTSSNRRLLVRPNTGSYTSHQRSYGKVLFPQICVCLSFGSVGGGGSHVTITHDSWLHPLLVASNGHHWRPVLGHLYTRPQKWHLVVVTEAWTISKLGVRLLQECCFVLYENHKGYIFLYFLEFESDIEPLQTEDFWLDQTLAYYKQLSLHQNSLTALLNRLVTKSTHKFKTSTFLFTLFTRWCVITSWIFFWLSLPEHVLQPYGGCFVSRRINISLFPDQAKAILREQHERLS